MDFRHCNSWLRGFLVCLFYLGLEQGCVHAQCEWEDCRDDYYNLRGNSAVICLSIELAENCLAQQMCPNNLQLIGFRSQLSIDREDNNCLLPTTSPTSTTTPTTTAPTEQPTETIVNCSLAQIPSNFTVTTMNNAVTVPNDPNPNSVLPVCTRFKLRALRQCSLYFHSHLRQWGSGTIQACSLPGSWYLINHPDVTVEVTAESDNAQSSFTRLTKVNITFPQTSCNAFLTHSYVAVRTELLPTNSTVGSFPTMMDTQVHVNSDRTVASILAPWFNFSAIIRNHGGHLSVVTQFDADEMAGADGLCSTGCPPHAQVNESTFLQQKCQSDKNQALFSCFHETAGVDNRIDNQLFTSLESEFISMCQLNILKLSRYDILSFMQAELNDTNALSDVGIFVTPEPDHPPPEDNSTQATQTLATTNTQPITTTTQPPTTAQPLITTQSNSSIIEPSDSNLHSSGSSQHRYFNNSILWLLLLVTMVISFLYQ